jgi:hypothetical protein
MKTRVLGGLLLALVWIEPVLAFEPAFTNSSDPSAPQPGIASTQPAQPGQAETDPAPAPMLGPPPSVTTVPSAALEAAAQGPPPTDSDRYFTLDELKSEMKKLAWTKGDFTITPYGTLWANMAYETARSVNGDYVLYVSRPRVDDNDVFHVDPKSTRLGFDVLGPHVSFFGDAQTGGRVEVDFQGTFTTENKASVLLRHAYIEVKNDEYRLLAGQTWDVISPLYPGVLFYTVGWDGGNIGYRRAQARGERYMALSDDLLITAQGSLNVDILADTLPAALTSDHSGWPVLEGRLAAALGPRGQGRNPIEVGVSSHIGEIILFPTPAPAGGLPRRTWSLNADIRVPITSRFGAQGELWTGENLATFFGGIGQGINLDPAMHYNTIRSRGGWVEVWYDWSERWHSHVGYSIDDPVDSDITSGRVYNSFIFANLTYDVTKKFMVGFELTSWRTLWKGPPAPVDAPDQNFNFVAKYGF